MMRVRSRTPAFARGYQPSTDVDRAVELGLRNASNTANWRQRRDTERGEKLRQLRRGYVERRQNAE